MYRETLTRAIFGAFAIATLSTGCAGIEASKKKEDPRVVALQSRLEEVERTNGRLNARVEELEDQIFLLNDRVEAHRIALYRRGTIRPDPARNSPPSPVTSYYPPGSEGSGVRDARPRRPVTRIPLEDGAEPAPANGVITNRVRSGRGQEEVVITEDQYRKDFGASRAAAPSRSTSTGGSSGRAPQPDVTDERLSTTKPSEPKPKAAPPTSAPPERPYKSGLAGYREALAAYRDGRYSVALAGFEAFLASNPEEDYVDNALYWIGECQYGLGSLDDAVRTFERVMREQPFGNKVPDSMLKMSLALDRLGERERATRVLQQLTERYPMTNAARLGAEKLEKRN